MSSERGCVYATTPVLVVSDLRRSVDFCVGALGFRDAGHWGEPPCFAMVHRDRFDLMLARAAAPDQVRPQGALGVWDFHMRVSDVEPSGIGSDHVARRSPATCVSPSTI
jgi:catechol 2,3-dioxygenase-like lactoylglutathione lyase family enzyme